MCVRTGTVKINVNGHGKPLWFFDVRNHVFLLHPAHPCEDFSEGLKTVRKRAVPKTFLMFFFSSETSLEHHHNWQLPHHSSGSYTATTAPIFVFSLLHPYNLFSLMFSRTYTVPPPPPSVYGVLACERPIIFVHTNLLYLSTIARVQMRLESSVVRKFATTDNMRPD